jgi:hypothetical protein
MLKIANNAFGKYENTILVHLSVIITYICMEWLLPINRSHFTYKGYKKYRQWTNAFLNNKAMKYYEWRYFCFLPVLKYAVIKRMQMKGIT